MQPGETITPGGNPDYKPEEPINPAQNSSQTQPEVASPWQFSQENESITDTPANIPTVQWSASEFIDHEKTSGWFVSLAGITGFAVVVIYLITKDLVTSVVIIIAAVLFAVTAKRKPRTLQYQIDHGGIIIGEKAYPYELFKSFAILAEGAFNSIQLMPLKRFMPPISLYFPPESEEQIITTLGSYLPHEERTHDPVERLMRRVRF